MQDMLGEVHKAFIGFTKRAEKSADEILARTFVDSAPLMDLLATRNNQVVYGRRGTGKTHALKFLAQKLQRQGKHPIYIDLRSVGSDGALYHDVSKAISERSIRLILDVLRVSIPTMVTPRSDAWRPPIPIDDDHGGVRAPLGEVGHLSVVA